MEFKVGDCVRFKPTEEVNLITFDMKYPLIVRRIEDGMLQFEGYRDTLKFYTFRFERVGGPW